MTKASVIVDIRYYQKQTAEQLLRSLVDCKSYIDDIRIITHDNLGDIAVPDVLSGCTFVNRVPDKWLLSESRVRNYGANIANSDYLVFLDNTVVATPSLFKNLTAEIPTSTIKMAYPAKLPLLSLKGEFLDAIYNTGSDVILSGDAIGAEIDAYHFCSLAFGLDRDTFVKVGGLHESDCLDEDFLFARKLSINSLPLILSSDLKLQSDSESTPPGDVLNFYDRPASKLKRAPELQKSKYPDLVA